MTQNVTPTFNDYHTCYHSNNKQHQTMSSVFNFYRVYGLSIKYVPYKYGQIGTNTVAVRHAYYGVVPNFGNTASSVPASE